MFLRCIPPKLKVRGFEKVSFEQYQKDAGKQGVELLQEYSDIILPRRATKYSAGYDFFSPISFTLHPGEQIKIPTGIKAYMRSNEVLQIYIRSNLSFKYNLRLKNCTGIIDSDYYNNPQNEGHIWIALVNDGDLELKIQKGNAIAQGIFMHYLIADNDSANNIRNGGIGSTDV